MLIDDMMEKEVRKIKEIKIGPDGSQDYRVMVGNETVRQEELRRELSRGQNFFIENVAEYARMKGNEDGGGVYPFRLPNLRPQFPTMWFEFSAKHIMLDPQSSNGSKVGIMVISDEDEDKKTVKISCCHYSKHQGIIIWHPAVPVFTVGFDGKFVKDESGKESIEVLHYLDTNSEAILDYIEGSAVTSSYPALLAISLMNCKNVKRDRVDAPPKLQRSRVKSGKLPLMSYHVLNIDPMKEVLDAARREAGPGTSIAKALHICRGHFKDFTEKGVFGKHKGWYWWHPHIRGTAHRIIIKDYEVSGPTKPSKEE
jgi:hypothetical protein